MRTRSLLVVASRNAGARMSGKAVPGIGRQCYPSGAPTKQFCPTRHGDTPGAGRATCMSSTARRSTGALFLDSLCRAVVSIRLTLSQPARKPPAVLPWWHCAVCFPAPPRPGQKGLRHPHCTPAQFIVGLELEERPNGARLRWSCKTVAWQHTWTRCQRHFNAAQADQFRSGRILCGPWWKEQGNGKGGLCDQGRKTGRLVDLPGKGFAIVVSRGKSPVSWRRGPVPRLVAWSVTRTESTLLRRCFTIHTIPTFMTEPRNGLV